MEKQVQLFPGVTVPYSVALWVKLVSQDNDGTYQSSNPKEDMATLLAAHFPQDALSAKFGGLVEYTIRARDNGKEGNIGDVVERRLAEEKARRSSRRKNTFRPVATIRYHQPDPRPQMPLRHELEELSGSETIKKHWGTNQILEYFSFVSDAQKNEVLRNIGDGDYHVGADRLRVSFQIGKFHGLVDNYSGTLQQKWNILNAIINSINNGNTKPKDLQRSIQLTDLVIEALGLEQMPAIIEHYIPFLKIKSLVPRRDIYNITSAMQTPELRRLKGPELMQELGYKPIEANNIPVLWYRPTAKPV